MRDELTTLLRRYEMKRQMEDYAIKRGYVPIEPTLFQEYEAFQLENQGVTKEQVVVVMNGQQQLYLLRPDITSSLIKQVLPHYQEGEEVKLCYQSKVYRSKSTGIKEVAQFGVEYLGDANGKSEREVLEIAIALLKDVPFILEVSHCGYLQGLFSYLQLDSFDKKKLKRLLRSKNKDDLRLFGDEHSFPDEVQQFFQDIFSFHGSLEEVIEKGRKYLFHDDMAIALEKLAQLSSMSEDLLVDLSLINEWDYYNGLIFKGYYHGLHKEVLSGGRYDVTTSTTSKNIVAIGFSIDTNAWISVRERNAAWSV